jgi:hemolysin activation/secretion protein
VAWSLAAVSALVFGGSPGLAAAPPHVARQPDPPSASPDAFGSEADQAKNKPDREPKPGGAKPLTAQPALERFDIDEYRVEGADALPQIEVEEAVYQFLGPNRTSEDVEKARAALEKAYHNKGYQTVSVSVPPQNARRGFVILKVAENRVGRLRVRGSRYFDLDKIKGKAGSLQEGTLPNFNDVTKDIVSLNQWPDRRVTPSLRAGVAPGTIDVDLNVEDKHPLHGSLELNNRQSPSTTPLRANASLRYDNLWQLGHSMTLTYQWAPLRRSDAEAYSFSYLARTDIDWLNVLVYGLKSASSVATVGGANVVGPGEVVGTRAVITLPTRGELFHTLSIGADYKHFGQTVALGTDEFSSPVTYVPIVASYGATWQGERQLTQLNASVTAGLRGLGSNPNEFDVKRFKATGSFFHVRSDVSHTQDFPGGAQLFLKAQGQIADQPLISSEQFSLGGLETVRGYLESETLGDYGAAGTVELRSPNVAPHFEQTLPNPPGDPVKFNAFNDWRFFAFVDAGRVRIKDPLSEQQREFDLASYGLGTRLKVLQYLNGMVLVGIPVISQQVTSANNPRVSFRLWGEF